MIERTVKAASDMCDVSALQPRASWVTFPAVLPCPATQPREVDDDVLVAHDACAQARRVWEGHRAGSGHQRSLNGPALWILITAALIISTVDALVMPAMGAWPLWITSSDQLARVTGMCLLSIRLGRIAGPLIGGLTMRLGGDLLRRGPALRAGATPTLDYAAVAPGTLRRGTATGVG